MKKIVLLILGIMVLAGGGIGCGTKAPPKPPKESLNFKLIH